MADLEAIAPGAQTRIESDGGEIRTRPDGMEPHEVRTRLNGDGDERGAWSPGERAQGRARSAAMARALNGARLVDPAIEFTGANFENLLSLLPYEVADAILNARQQTMNQFFESWHTSMEKIRKLDEAADVRAGLQSAQIDESYRATLDRMGALLRAFPNTDPSIKEKILELRRDYGLEPEAFEQIPLEAMGYTPRVDHSGMLAAFVENQGNGVIVGGGR